MTEKKPPLLQVRNLKKHFPIRKGFFRRIVGKIRAIDGVSFCLHDGECVGLVGESGSGKTTTGRVILRAMEPTEGDVLFRTDEGVVDVMKASREDLKALRRAMQMIFQDPYSSLNPRMTVLDIVGEPLLVHGMKRRAEREGHVRELLARVGLRPHHLNRYPHAFSGGQRQRIGIARALALQPKLIVADEPVSALDVSVQAQVLNLLRRLQERFDLTYLLVAHDLSVVRHISDRVAVMYAGRLVEVADTERLYERPHHPYTEALLSAMPFPSPARKKKRVLLSGEVADPSDLPSGCVFHPRCRYAGDRCRTDRPELRQLEPGRLVRCHRSEKLNLQGLSS